MSKLSERLSWGLNSAPKLDGYYAAVNDVDNAIRDLEQRLEAAERMLQESDSINLDILRKAQTAARIEELDWVLRHTIERDAGMWFGNRVLEDIEERIAELKGK